MAIQRWDPQRDMIELQGRMNRLFDEALSRSSGSEPAETLGTSVMMSPQIKANEEEVFAIIGRVEG